MFDETSLFLRAAAERESEEAGRGRKRQGDWEERLYKLRLGEE